MRTTACKKNVRRERQSILKEALFEANSLLTADFDHRYCLISVLYSSCILICTSRSSEQSSCSASACFRTLIRQSSFCSIFFIISCFSLSAGLVLFRLLNASIVCRCGFFSWDSSLVKDGQRDRTIEQGQLLRSQKLSLDACLSSS